MVGLIYLYDDLPLIPTPTAESVREVVVDDEYFPVIETSGIVIGKATRTYCHGGSMLLHPVVHLHIIDRYGHIYLQKRSLEKKIQPGKWDTAVGGHVAYGESIQEALFREAREELRFSEFNPVHLCSYEFTSDIEREFVNVFAAVGSFDLQPDHDEVDDGKWWKIEEIDANIGNQIFTPNFESEYLKIKKSLLALL